MDEADKAQKEVDLQLQLSITNKKRELENALTIPTADECAECGELIPSARQIAVPGCQHCIDCAENFEQKQRRIKV